MSYILSCLIGTAKENYFVFSSINELNILYILDIFRNKEYYHLNLPYWYLVPNWKVNVVSSNPAQARCIRYNIMWWSLSVTCGRSVVFSVYSGLLQQ